MSGFGKLAWTEIKLYLREPVAAFFTVAWAPLMLVLFGSMYGNTPDAFYGGYGFVDVTTAAYMALVIDTVGLLSIPVSVASRRAGGMLRRLRATPLKASTFILTDVLTFVAVGILGTVVMCAVAIFGFGAHFTGNVGLVALAFLLTTLSMYALGYLLAALSPSVSVANILGMVVGFVMMFLSGATIPLEVMPAGVKEVSRYIPLTYGVDLLKASWLQGSWEGQGLAVGVLAGILVVAGLLAVRLWRWD